MAHRKVFATENGRYGTRMLTAGDEMTLSGPAARAMIALGRASGEPPVRHRQPAPASNPAAEEKEALRAAYQTKFGRRPFNGWGADVLREKLSEADA
jgi:hypothetical protein